MTRRNRLSSQPAGKLWRACSDDHAAQIAEFAISLPLLVIFVIGIFDFSGALSLKQKLSNAAREGARVAAADPASDLGSPPPSGPASVMDAWQVVDNYLNSEHIADCGMSFNAPTLSSGLTWVSTNTAPPCGSTSGLILSVNRGCIPQPVSTTGVNVVATCVTIQYPYKWRYSNVASLVGARFTGPTSITTTATAFNEN